VPKPFRFGVNAMRVESRAAWHEKARRLEGDGWSTLFVPDHLGGVSTFAPLVSAADATSILRVGSLVVNNDLFRPLRLAQEAATVDVLTDGRFELGLGSGWNKPEYDVLGLSYDKPAQRAARLREAVGVMKAAWAGEIVLSRGEGAASVRAVPEPAQRPHPPLLIGGHGDAVLGFAAVEADIVSLSGLTWTGTSLAPASASIDAWAERVAFVKDRAGARFDRLELSILAQAVAVGSCAGAIQGRLAAAFAMDEEHPLTLIGSVSEIVDKLVAMRERLGISYVVVFDSAVDDMTPVVKQLAGT
jgi:probable F420-dependent oxidoreductase